jgi:SAM-dependent methyltransferase
VLDNLLPPILRDAWWFMAPFFWALFGRRAREFTSFKDRAVFLSSREFKAWYERTADLHIKRPSDLTEASARAVLDALEGDTVLDVGAGRGYLLRRIAQQVQGPVVGVDLVTPSEPGPSFVRAVGETLPFRDRSFDTVTCCHVLEHVQDFDGAVRELRRVARKRVVIVVPRQREYRYTFDLHVRFFPYPHSLCQALRSRGLRCDVVDNDIVFVEEVGRG